MIAFPRTLVGPRTYAFGPFRLDATERRLTRDGSDVVLTPKSFDLLLTLLQRAGHLQSREALLDLLWPNSVVEDHTLTWNLSAVRRALGDAADPPRYIETVRGYGYRFIAAVEILDPRPAGSADPVHALRAIDESSALPAPSDTEASTATIESEPMPDVTQAHAVPIKPRRRFVVALAITLTAAAAAAGALAWLRHSEHAEPAPAATIADHSIAVLPFENLSPDPANAYFASGIQETILTQLASISDLRVISRLSTASYTTHPDDLDAVFAELHVASILEGSVQKAGDEVLINVQLIDGRTHAHRWAHSYRRALADAFEVQSDVAEQVASALQARLLPTEASRVTRLPTQDSEAYDLFLRGEYAASLIEGGSANDRRATTAQARDFYRQAIARDPHFALAFARLSYLESHAYWLPIEHTPARAEAGLRAAEQALALDPELAQAHLAMGYSHYYAHRDYSAALDEFHRALRDLPNNADVNASIANIERRRGEWDAALSGYRRAELLDPRNPQWPSLIGNTLTAMRDYAQADAAYERARVVDPHNATATVDEAFDKIMLGDTAGASSILATLPPDADPDGYATVARFIARFVADDADSALAVLEHAPPQLEAPWTPSLVPTDLLRAQALELKGERDAARPHYASARAELEEMLRAQPDDAATLSLLGLAEAGLRNDDAALAAGRRAVQLLPVEQDAAIGWCYLATLAEIETRIGRVDDAVALFATLLKNPAGRVISTALIEHDPRFESVRTRLK